MRCRSGSEALSTIPVTGSWLSREAKFLLLLAAKFKFINGGNLNRCEGEERYEPRSEVVRDLRPKRRDKKILGSSFKRINEY